MSKDALTRGWCPRRWNGPWYLTTTLQVGPGESERSWARLWLREYVELDGHEDCCSHTGMITGPVLAEGNGYPEGWPDGY